ncbi:MAG: protein kinase, partial [Gammaproteobacteria bacterium]|nr:protein kinase [Gammaproteobacteria bacterium]
MPDAPAPSSTHGRFLPGARLGERYRIVGLLGRGGMGEVYRADDLELGQSVALKFLPEKLAADTMAWHRLRSEVRTARQLAHPNICRVYDIARVDGHVFFSMEYVDGDDLSHVLRRLGPPSKDKAVQIARQLCAGLAAAHESGILHRDLKPANVMLDGRGRVRITDFGLAGLAEELQANPQRVGTPAYMAPEQLESGTVSGRSDIYSLGLVLYELFTGKRPFEDATVDPTTSVPSLQSHSESVDPAVDRIVQRCLEPDPAERPASAYEVMAALPGGDPLAAALEAGETPSPEMVADAEARGGLAPRTGLVLFGLAILSLVVLGLVGPRWTTMPEKSPEALADIAHDIVLELGHEFPAHEASLLFAADSVDPSATDRGHPWPPAYYYWHGARRGSMQPLFVHSPMTRPGDPASRPPGTVDVVLGSSGRLVDLDIVPPLYDPPIRDSTTATDWTLVLERA